MFNRIAGIVLLLVAGLVLANMAWIKNMHFWFVLDLAMVVSGGVIGGILLSRK